MNYVTNKYGHIHMCDIRIQSNLKEGERDVFCRSVLPKTNSHIIDSNSAADGGQKPFFNASSSILPTPGNWR